MTYSSSFDINSARDFFQQVVIPQHEDFIANNASSRHAVITIIVAYHMYEWVNGSKFELSKFCKKYPQEVNLGEVFELARNITNGTKHFIPKVTTHTQMGFSSAFSDAYARPLMVEYPDDRKEPVDIFLKKIMDFWVKQERNGAF